MSNQQILEKAIQKAVEDGWFDVAGLCGYTIWSPVSVLDTLIILEDRDTHEKRQYNYQAIIFNHDFAKALWGYKLTYTRNLPEGSFIKVSSPMQADDDSLPEWAYHLQRMVIAPDPISYLADHT